MLNKRAAISIIRAQVASDGGKSIEELSSMLCNYSQESSYIWQTLNLKGYANKDFNIVSAIKAIIADKNSGFTFYVKPEGNSFVVYFNFKLKHARKQVSFHSFNPLLSRYVNKKHATKWDKNSSRQTCLELFEEVFLG